MQAFRLRLDRQLRLWARAQWTLDGKVAFLLSAWLRPDQDMQVEGVDASASRSLPMREFRFQQMDLKDLGMILNVFDCNRDGSNRRVVKHASQPAAATKMSP